LVKIQIFTKNLKNEIFTRLTSSAFGKLFLNNWCKKAKKNWCKKQKKFGVKKQKKKIGVKNPLPFSSPPLSLTYHVNLAVAALFKKINNNNIYLKNCQQTENGERGDELEKGEQRKVTW